MHSLGGVHPWKEMQSALQRSHWVRGPPLKKQRQGPDGRSCIFTFVDRNYGLNFSVLAVGCLKSERGCLEKVIFYEHGQLMLQIIINLAHKFWDFTFLRDVSLI